MTESTQLEDSDSASTDEDEINAATIVLNPNQETSMDVDSVFETYDSNTCLLYTSPSPRDPKTSRMPSSA